MKRTVLTAAALALLTMPAKTQLMLPPAPLTQWQTEMLNVTMVAFYVYDCKQGKDMEYAVNLEFSYRVGRTSVSQSREANDIVRAKINEMGRDKFCAMGDQDHEVQVAFKRIKTRYNGG
jgi:hypothetical protein